MITQPLSPFPLNHWDSAGGAARRGAALSLARRLALDPVFLIGLAVVLFWIIVAVGWRRLAPHDPFAINPASTLAPPSRVYWLGTDDLGRDVFARVLAGAAPVLVVAPVATVLSVVCGTTLGLVAGYYRGIIDDILMRLVEAIMSLPAIIPATIVLALVGRSLPNVVVTIAILFSPLVARTVRAAVLVEREREYIDAARLRGDRGAYILVFEILPNVLSPLLVEATLRLGYAVFTAGTLSFLQLGIQPPSADWGLTVAGERAFVQVAPWTVLSPAIALASLVVGVNLTADGLRRRLVE